ncbi:hypothetical protein AMTRI_Chr11g154220 [Amborella trichopoda]
MRTNKMDNFLVDQLLKLLHLGRRVENGFRREAYTKICNEFKKVTGIVLTSENIKTRMKTWKRHYD